MKTLTIPLKQLLPLLLLGAVIMSFNQAMAKSDMEMMGDLQKAREKAHKGKDHSKHKDPVDSSQEFHGVYYGFVPCKDCPGLKMTMSLKNRSNYLIVTQNAQAAGREYYEKGKYTWDDKSAMVTLISRKDTSVRKFRIKDEDTLIMLSAEGKTMKGEQKRYILRKADQKESRQGHLH
jgi:hypothetical protein